MVANGDETQLTRGEANLSVDELFVGERGRQMTVLSSSLPETEALRLAHHLDLPGQSPQGFELTTYVSGAPIGDYYVIARTSADPGAKRGGMVFSHAFVANVVELARFNNIYALFDRLIRERPVEASAQRREIPDHGCAGYPPPGRFCDMLTERSGSAVVTADTGFFEDLIVRLWPHLLPGMRARLRFGLSFGPEDAINQGLQIALVPTVIAARWPADKRIHATNSDVSAVSAAGRFLQGADDGALSRFIDSLMLDDAGLSDLFLIGRAFEIASSPSLDFKCALTGLRLIGRLQPAADRGDPLKQNLLNAVLIRPGPAGSDELLALRNLDWTPFSGLSVRTNALTDKFTEFFAASGAAGDKIKVLKSVLTPAEATDEWTTAGEHSLAAMTKAAAPGFAPATWSLMMQDCILGARVLALSPEQSLDPAMSACAPNSSGAVASVMADALIAAGYLRAEAALLIQRHGSNLHSALVEACERDRSVFGDLAIKAIMGMMPDPAVVEAAVELGENLVQDFAASKVAITPGLLASQDLATPLTQTLWLKALSKAPDAWRILSDVEAIQTRLFTALEAAGVNAELLHKVMDTPVGNWLDFPRRAELWSILPAAATDTTLARTARAWIAVYPESADPTFFTPEEALGRAIAAPVLRSDLLSAMKHYSFGHAIDAFVGNKHLPQDAFTEIFQALYRSERWPEEGGAERAGELVAARNWRSVTAALFQRYDVPSDLRDYFQVCADHLGIWDRLIHGLHQPSIGELFDLLVETACELYPEGPREKDIWDRAGGDISKLTLSGSGRQQWRAAVRAIRYGGEPRAEALTAAMMDDFPLNTRLRHMAKEL